MFGLSNLIFKKSNIFFQVVSDLTVTELHYSLMGKMKLHLRQD
jgi:hypothetical protein